MPNLHFFMWLSSLNLFLKTLPHSMQDIFLGLFGGKSLATQNMQCQFSGHVKTEWVVLFLQPPRAGQDLGRISTSTHKWAEHSPRKRTNFRFSDTWSMAGPGPGSSLKVLHSVPLVTNLPFFRFSDTWNLHLASQSRNKGILIWNYFVLTISVNCLRDRM